MSEAHPTREECVTHVARIYEGILADPVRRAEILAVRTARAAERIFGTQPSTPAGGQAVDTRVRAVGGQRDHHRRSA